jgi:dihydroorotase-like cyclic amidohydrolase
VYNEGVVKNRITIFDLVRVLSENPAKIFGFHHLKGDLTPGKDADLVIFDPKEKWTISADKLHFHVGWTPYENMKIQGKVKTTIVRGKIVFDDGKIIGEKGFGQFVIPKKNKRYLD